MSTPASGRTTPWHGVWRVAGVQLRTGRVGLVGTAVIVAALVLFTARAVVGFYDDVAAREVYRAAMGASPASMAVNGRGYDLDGLGGIVAYEVGFFALLVLPVFAIHLAIRHTRTEEDLGRADLVTAQPVGRLSPLGAGAAVVGGSMLAGGLLTWLALVWVGLEVAGSTRYALALTLWLACCAVLGLVAGQVTTQSRAAHGLALGTLAFTYLVRGIVDGLGLEAAWLTPMGWLAEVRPFGTWQWLPLLAMAALAAAGFAACIRLRQRRDLGGGLLAARPGPATASAWLDGPTALLWRIGRVGVVGWLLGATVWALALGLLTGEVRDIVAANPEVGAMLGAAGRVEDGVVALGAATVAIAGAAAVVQSVLRALAEETTGRLGLVVATPVSRLRWSLAVVGFAGVQAAATLVAGGLALGLGVRVSLGGGDILPALTATIAFLPSVCLVGAIATALLAWRPAWTVAGWVPVVWGLVVVLLGDTLRLTAWARNLSPFEHVGRVPVVGPDLTALWLLSGLSVALLLSAGARFARRDLVAG